MSEWEIEMEITDKKHFQIETLQELLSLNSQNGEEIAS